MNKGFNNIKKIVITGPPGSGKSSLAKKLGEITGYDIHHLDRYYHTANWIPIDKNEFTEIVYEIIQSEEWIIDGNYRRTLELRVERADLIIYFDYCTIFSFYRIYKRIVKTKLFSIKRTDISDDCKERWFDKNFVLWTINFNRRNRVDIINIIKDYKSDVALFYIIKSAKDAEKLIEYIKFTRKFNSEAV
ncbi:MAG: hypothetical protein HGGPFJEG_01635 [Ignavibacteria bacterium]|nr:hypothetical protein [Ignavibacteria bacterium]